MGISLLNLYYADNGNNGHYLTLNMEENQSMLNFYYSLVYTQIGMINLQANYIAYYNIGEQPISLIAYFLEDNNLTRISVVYSSYGRTNTIIYY